MMHIGRITTTDQAAGLATRVANRDLPTDGLSDTGKGQISLNDGGTVRFAGAKSEGILEDVNCSPNGDPVSPLKQRRTDIAHQKWRKTS